MTLNVENYNVLKIGVNMENTTIDIKNFAELSSMIVESHHNIPGLSSEDLCSGDDCGCEGGR